MCGLVSAFAGLEGDEANRRSDKTLIFTRFKVNGKDSSIEIFTIEEPFLSRIELSPDIALYRMLTLFAALCLSAAPALAQRTVVQEAGGGRKIELTYDAAGKVTEIRTLGAEGQLLQKQILEYPPGGYVPLTTSTSYWPNGKVHKVTRDTYDNNANFTGEFIAVYDESGKQTSGHELRRDPDNGFYHCADWNLAAQKYLHVDCPAGEESAGPPETVKKFTAAEVMQQLEQARTAKPTPRLNRPPSAQAETGSNVKEVGLILPAGIRRGEHVSGSVVDDPSHYEGMPEIVVTRVALPFTASGPASTLTGWTVEVGGAPAQPADGPITLAVSSGRVEFLFRQAENAGSPVSKEISIGGTASGKGKAPTNYLAPALCLKNEVCAIHGPFAGDSSKTFAAFEQRRARILAETPEAAYLAVPERTEPGPRPLVIAEGSKVVAFPMVVAEFTLTPERRELPKGEKMLMYATVDGPADLPDPLWLPGNYPPSNLELARKLIPGFQLPGAKREAREAAEKREAKEKQASAAGKKNEGEEEDRGGEILLVVKNASPDQVTLHEAKNGTFVLHLKAQSFAMGEFRYKFVVEAIKSGNFTVQGYAIPLLAPVTGQEFPATAEASTK